LLYGFAVSTESWTIVSPEGPVGIFGCAPGDDEAMVGIVWMLACPDLLKHRIEFLRRSREMFNKFHARWPVLHNFVDSRNTQHLRWLEWLGVSFVEKINVNGVAFYGFVHL
jgi:hypothetical protein